VTMIAKSVVEIAVIELVTAGAGSAIAGAAGVADVAEIGSAGFAVARGAGLTGRAYEAGAALAEGGGMAGRLTRMLARNRVAAGGVEWLANGQTVAARGARSLVHATAFAEGQQLMHGRTLQIIDDPGGAAWEVATTAATMWALGATQRFMRGQMGGMATPGLTQGAAGAAEGAVSSGSRIPLLGAASRKMGELLANQNLVIRNAAEIAPELLVMHEMGQLEKWASVKAGMLSQTQLDAMDDPVAWHEYAQTAGVVLGLRGWGIARENLAQLQGRILSSSDKKGLAEANKTVPKAAETEPGMKSDESAKKAVNEPGQDEQAETKAGEKAPPAQPEVEKEGLFSRLADSLPDSIRAKVESIRTALSSYMEMIPEYKQKFIGSISELTESVHNHVDIGLAKEKIESAFRFIFAINAGEVLTRDNIIGKATDRVKEIFKGLKPDGKFMAAIRDFAKSVRDAVFPQSEKTEQTGKTREAAQKSPLSKEERIIINNLKSYLDRYRDLKPEQQDAVLKTLLWVTSLIRSNRTSLSQKKAIVKHIFGVDPAVELTEGNWNKNTNRKFTGYHPDHNPGNESAAELYKRIFDLSDKAKAAIFSETVNQQQKGAQTEQREAA
jgi:hypothetical protein